MTDAQVPVDLTVSQFRAAILCLIPTTPETFNRIVDRYGLKKTIVTGSSERLQTLRIIAYQGVGWGPASTYMVRLQSNQQGDFGRLAAGTEIQLLPEVFGQDRTFIIGEVYDLRALADEARQYAQTT